MTLGGTVSSVMIRIRGDGSDAVKALDDVADEAKKTEKELDKAASGGDKMGMAMGLAAGAAAALAAAAAGVAAAVSAYSATNQDAADTLAGLSSNMNDMMVAVGGAIYESEGFQEVLGRVAQVQPELVPLFDAWCRWAREGGKQPLLSDYANQSRGQLSVYSTL